MKSTSLAQKMTQKMTQKDRFEKYLSNLYSMVSELGNLVSQMKPSLSELPIMTGCSQGFHLLLTSFISNSQLTNVNSSHSFYCMDRTEEQQIMFTFHNHVY